MMHTIKETQKLTGMTRKMIYDQIKNGKAHSEKRGREWFVDITTLNKGDSRRTDNARLKEQLTEMQILKIKQQIDEGKKEIEASYRNVILNEVFDLLTNLKQKLNSLKLTEEQCREIDKTIAETIDNLPHLKEL